MHPGHHCAGEHRARARRPGAGRRHRAAHLLVKPWERRASAEGNADWFRFWLKGEEDPDSTKAEQYARWHELRKLQVAPSAADTVPATSTPAPGP